MNTNKFDFTLVGIDGTTPLLGSEENSNAGKILGNNIFTNGNADAIKAHTIAMKIYNHVDSDLDKSDTAFLKKHVENCNLIVGIKVQLLKCFE